MHLVVSVISSSEGYNLRVLFTVNFDHFLALALRNYQPRYRRLRGGFYF